jgi:hypothetical protein
MKKPSISPALLSVVLKPLCDLLSAFLALILYKYAPKKQMVPPKQGKSVFSLSDKVKDLDWLKGICL